MKLVCISDTHSLHRRMLEIPDGDVLIHAGDCLGAGTLDNVGFWGLSVLKRHKPLQPISVVAFRGVLT